jgi:hypothetical protein
MLSSEGSSTRSVAAIEANLWEVEEVDTDSLRVWLDFWGVSYGCIATSSLSIGA